MPKYLVKRLLWLILLAAAVAGLWGVFSGVDSLIIYYQQGADPASALHIVPNVPVDLHVKIDWQADDADTGRMLEPITRSDIQSAYLRAWLQWNLSLLKNEPYGLQTYFGGPALADISSTIHEVAAKGWLIEQADMSHILHLHLYSADGSIASFTDSNATVVDIIHQKNGGVVDISETASVYQVVMLLEDGNWRVRQWVQTSDQPLDAQTTSLQTPRGFVGKDSASPRLTLNGTPYHIAGINYYPKDTPWDRFWTRYDPLVIDHDFRIIHALGLTTIRIFLPFDQFGGAELGANPGLQPAASISTAAQNAIVKDPLDKVADLLTRASAHDLHVIATLFDFHSDYTLLHWPETDRQLEALLSHFKGAPALLAWDLKNEPDQDYHASGSYLVDAWLKHTAYLARHYDPHHLLTIGWATPQAAQTGIPGIDFVSFHYYAPATGLATAYASLRAVVPGQPIVLEEFGLPTWNSFFFPNGHTEAEQATYYADVLRFLRISDSSGYLCWTLYDFSYVPSGVAGSWPWQMGPQKAMGVLHSDGRPKSAAQLLAPGARLTVPSIPLWASVVKPFWLTASISVSLSLALLVFVLKRRRRHSRH